MTSNKLLFKESEGYYVVVVDEATNVAVQTTLGIVRKSQIKNDEYVFDPTNFTYTATELAEIVEFMKGKDNG